MDDDQSKLDWPDVQEEVFVHFGDLPELPGAVIAADFTDRQCWVEKFNEPLGVQLQVAEQRLHTWTVTRIFRDFFFLPSF